MIFSSRIGVEVQKWRGQSEESNFWQTGSCDIGSLTDTTSSVSWKKSSSELRHIQLSLHLDHISQVLKLKNILHDMGEQIQVIQKLINATRSGLIECDQVRIQCHWNPRTKSQTGEEKQQVEIEWRDMVWYGRIEWPEWNLCVEFMSWKYVTLQCFGGAGGTTHLYVLNGKSTIKISSLPVYNNQAPSDTRSCWPTTLRTGKLEKCPSSKGKKGLSRQRLKGQASPRNARLSKVKNRLRQWIRWHLK